MNFLKKPTRLLKGILLGVGTGLLDLIVHLEHGAAIADKRGEDGDRSVADTVAAVQYNGKESREDLIDRPK